MKVHIYAVSISLFLSSFVNAAYSEKKDDVRLTIHDLSMQSDRKLIGDSVGPRKISELKRYGIYPLLVKVNNKAHKSYLLSPHHISVPMLSTGDLALKVPIDKKEDLWVLFGTLGAEVMTLLALTPLFEDRVFGDWTKHVTNSPSWRAPLSLAASGMFACLFLKGLLHMTKAGQNRKKDQISWMNEHVLSSGGITIYPSSEAQRYIFLDKAAYENGRFSLALQSTDGDQISFDVNILP